jgi:hypothetical protein
MTHLPVILSRYVPTQLSGPYHTVEDTAFDEDFAFELDEAFAFEAPLWCFAALVFTFDAMAAKDTPRGALLRFLAIDLRAALCCSKLLCDGTHS